MHIRAFGIRVTIVLRDEFLSWKVLRDAKSMGTAALRSSSNCLHLLPCFPITSILPSIFPSITCFRRQYIFTEKCTWSWNTNSQCESGNGTYYNVINMKEFTGMMCEKEKCYSMSFSVTFTRKWHVPDKLLGNAVRPCLLGNPYFPVPLFERKGGGNLSTMKNILSLMNGWSVLWIMDKYQLDK